MKMKNKYINILKYGLPFSSVIVLSLISCDYLEAGLSDQVTKAGTFLNGPILKTGLGGATIVGSIGAAVRGSLAMAGGIMGVGIALAFYLGWVNSESFIQ